MVTFRTKSDVNNTNEDTDWYDNIELLENENNLKQNIYLLFFDKCKYDGEIDPTKPFLKLSSITQFNEVLTDHNFDHSSMDSSLKIDRFNRDHLRIQAINKTDEDFLDYNANLIIKLLNKILYIEEVLPFLNFTQHLNKQQIVTQNLKKNPSLLDMNILSILSEPKLETTNKYLHKISSNLWSQLIACNLRQKQHRDFCSSTFPANYFYKMPSNILTARFVTSIEFYFNNEYILNEKEKNSIDKNGKISIINTTIELKSLESFYELIKNEWMSMCQIYKLVLEVKQAFIKYPDLITKIETKCINFKKFIVYYGPKQTLKIQFEWSKETKSYDITLGVNRLNNNKLDSANPHLLFINEVKSFFARNQSVINLIRILNSTCMFAYSLKKLINLPRINSKFVLNQSFLAFSNFMLIVYSLNHVRLTYNAKYWVDVQMNLKTSLISLRDSYFEVLDTKKEAEHYSVLRFLNVSFILLLISN